jgi:hypothetical protein
MLRLRLLRQTALLHRIILLRQTTLQDRMALRLPQAQVSLATCTDVPELIPDTKCTATNISGTTIGSGPQARFFLG